MTDAILDQVRTTTVDQVMNPNVLTIRPNARVEELIALLVDQGITGVPVVDAGRRLVGVVSATDVLRLAYHEVELEDVDLDPHAVDWPEEEHGFFRDDALPRAPRGLGELPRNVFDDFEVEDIMTPATFSVRPNATLQEAAKFMTRGRIHRALVTERGRLLGILTAFDIVRALADAEPV